MATVPDSIQVAAASPTFGRLFEGTTRLRLVKPRPPGATASGHLPAKLLTIRTPETATLKEPTTTQTTVGSRTENCWGFRAVWLSRCFSVENGTDNQARWRID